MSFSFQKWFFRAEVVHITLTAHKQDLDDGRGEKRIEHIGPKLPPELLPQAALSLLAEVDR
jgi:hypothetical protein